MGFWMRFIKLLSLLALLATVAGCSMLPNQIDETAGWSAKKLYTEAKKDLDAGDYTSAESMFTKIEARYPYGVYAQQAQLDTIYAYYRQEEPSAAVAAADRFIKLHPRNPSVDYAYYMRGVATFYPGRNFLERFFPQDPSRRDPSTARDSFNYFKELIKRYPNSRYTHDALLRMVYLRNSLAMHEIFVADYYMRRHAFLAAANRAGYVVRNYQRTPAVPQALAIMVRAYRKMELPKLAGDTLRVLKENFPNSPELSELGDG